MYQRALIVFVILLGLVGIVTACGGAAPTTTAQVSALDTSYPDALNARSQLLLGTVRLEEGNGPTVSKEQAAKLLLLWQASKSLAGSGASSQAEIDAVTNQILALMTTEQIQAIKALHLVQADMQAFNQALGVAAPGGVPSGGVPGSGPGQGQTLSPGARATFQAEMGTSGNAAGGGTAAVDKLIELLKSKAQP